MQKRRISKWISAADKARQSVEDSSEGILRRISSSNSMLSDELTEQFGDEWDPELCVKLLRVPTVQNFSGFKRVLERSCGKAEWMREFLSLRGVEVLFEALGRLCDS